MALQCGTCWLEKEILGHEVIDTFGYNCSAGSQRGPVPESSSDLEFFFLPDRSVDVDDIDDKVKAWLDSLGTKDERKIAF